MKKIILMTIALIMVSVVFALSSTVPNFVGKSNPFTLNLTTPKIVYLDIPFGQYINASLNFTVTGNLTGALHVYHFQGDCDDETGRNDCVNNGCVFKNMTYGQGIYCNQSDAGDFINYTFKNISEAFTMFAFIRGAGPGLSILDNRVGGNSNFLQVYTDGAAQAQVSYGIGDTFIGNFGNIDYATTDSLYTFTYDAADSYNFTIYRNDTQVASKFSAFPVPSLWNDDRYFHGGTLGAGAWRDLFIDELYIFNKTFTEAEVKDFYDNFINYWVNIKYGNYDLTISKNVTEIDISTDIQTILNQSCSCPLCSVVNNKCRIGFNYSYFPGLSGLVTTEIINITYIYGVDDCSNYNFKIGNISYQDEFDFSPLTVDTITYNLNIAGPFSQVISGTFTNSVSDNFCSLTNITQQGVDLDVYGSLTLQKAGYTTRIYTNDISNAYVFKSEPLTELVFYLLNTGNTSQVTFNIKDILTLLSLDTVKVDMALLNNGTYSVVESRLSDIIGNVVFSYQTNKAYRFNFTKRGYSKLSFDVNPITSSEYDIFLIPTQQINASDNYARININYEPVAFYDNRTTIFNFTIFSVYDELNSYSYNLSYPGGFVTNSGSTASGEPLSSTFAINGASMFDRVKLQHTYNTDLAGTRTVTQYFNIIVQPLNTTLAGQTNKTYGLGLFERLLIVVMVSILIVGIGSLIGQPLPAMMIGLLLFGYWVFVGFIPLWSVLISIFVAIILISARSE